MALSLKPVNQLSLQRYPSSGDPSLLPWNAADILLLEYVRDNYFSDGSNNTSINCLIINDQFGTLSVSLNDLSPFYWTDSYLSEKAIEINLQTNLENNIAAKPFPVAYQNANGDQSGNGDHGDIGNRIACHLDFNNQFDLVLIRIPKHNSLLEFQLTQIKPWISVDTKIVAAGMTKEIHKSNLKLFESILGETSTSLAKKKARLIFCQPDNTDRITSVFKRYHLPQYQLDICGLPGVFSRDKLDIGTRVLLDHLPQMEENESVIDLGCGSGVIGAVIAKKQPDCRVLLVDESQLAIESARLTFQTNQLDNGQFVRTDVLQGIEKNRFDRVFCNPPFHQQNVQTLTIAKTMFKQSARCLKSDGKLFVVANRHLKYQRVLESYFYRVKPISKDRKFIVWLAESPRRNSR